MKIRQGHVSNSSSSSFIIAYKKIPDFDKETLEKYPVLKYVRKLIKDLFGGGDTIKTIQELEEQIVAENCYGDCDTLEKVLEEDEVVKEEYQKSKSALENGFEIITIEVENYDTSRLEIIGNIADGENVIMIGSDG